MRVQAPASAARRPELDALTTNRSLAMPLLPTLATAVAIASLSLLCRQPAALRPGADPATVPAIVSAAAPTSADGFRGAGEAVDPKSAVPGTIAFGQLYPLNADVVQAAASRQPPTKLAARRSTSSPKRGDTARSAANPPHPLPEPAPLPLREADDQGEALPEGTLPFVPTAAAVVDAVRGLGGEAATLGGSVLGSLALMR